MGVGYASANNIVSALVQSSNTISNSLSSNSNNVTSVYTGFNCYGGTYGTIDITNYSAIKSLVNQTLNQTDVSALISNVSQDITQTASATVEGLAGFIIALAILIVAIGYVAFKPFGMLLGNKMIVFTALACILAGVIVFLWYQKVPPFFNLPTQCAPLSGMPGCTDGDQCINIQNDGSTTVKSPPMRYALDLVGSSDQPGLLTMLISRMGEEHGDSSNGGWNSTVYQYFEKSDLVAKYGLPNPLDGNYNTNVAGWNGLDPNTGLNARFLICNILEIDTSVYMFDGEQCMVGGIVLPSTDPKCYKFTPTIMPDRSNMDMGLEVGGTVTGMFGVCNSSSYKIQTFMKKGGFLIPIVLFIGLGAFMFFYNTRTSTQSGAATSTTGTPQK